MASGNRDQVSVMKQQLTELDTAIVGKSCSISRSTGLGLSANVELLQGTVRKYFDSTGTVRASSQGVLTEISNVGRQVGTTVSNTFHDVRLTPRNVGSTWVLFCTPYKGSAVLSYSQVDLSSGIRIE